MVSPIDVINGAGYSGSSFSIDDKKLGRDAFLKILLAQLRYQDPLDPMKGTEFTAELAQFSSLEQLFNVNDQLGEMKSVQYGSTFFQALGLIGKEIRAQGDSINLGEEGGASGTFYISEPAECTVIIEDMDGSVIRKIPMGRLEAGRHDFQWDGRDESGNRVGAGAYRFSVMAVSDSGEAVPVDTYITGTVTRVSVGGSLPVLYIGDVAVDLASVSEATDPGE